MLLTFKTEIGTGQAMGQFFEKIIFQKISAMGSGNQPAVSMILIMGRAQDLAAGQQLPAGLFAVIIPVSQRQVDEMIFEQ